MPQFGVRWQSRGRNFWESLGAVLLGPGPAPGAETSLLGRFRWTPRRARLRGLAGSFLWHAVLLSISIPVSQMAEPAPKISLPQIEITWYGPITDVAPTPKPLEKPPTKQPAPEPKPKREPERTVVARAYNPNTTVIFNPPKPTNTRQVLIEPDAPPNEPNFLPPLPNIIRWEAAAPAQPSITFQPGALKAKQAQAAAAAMQAPQVAVATPPAGPLNIVPNPNATPKPPLPLTPSAIRPETARAKVAPAQAPQMGNGVDGQAALGLADSGAALPPPLPPTANAAHGERAAPAPTSAAAPDITGTGNRMVSLSLAPGPNVTPPIGNASARVSIGPHVGKDVSEPAPEISGNGGPSAGTLSASAAAPGPAGLLILHDRRQPAAPPAPPPAAPPPVPKPEPRIAAPTPFSPREAMLAARPAKAGKTANRVVPHDLVHNILGYGQVHTMLVNMPNLTSATGSWVLNFAAMPGEKVAMSLVMAPLPVRKVDPEYPPELRNNGISGVVILYAEIDSHGAVKNIRVVQSVDPELDHNAEAAFAKWKFMPALLNDKPLALEVLVHIPFRTIPSSTQ